MNNLLPCQLDSPSTCSTGVYVFCTGDKCILQTLNGNRNLLIFNSELQAHWVPWQEGDGKDDKLFDSNCPRKV